MFTQRLRSFGLLLAVVAFMLISSCESNRNELLKAEPGASRTVSAKGGKGGGNVVEPVVAPGQVQIVACSMGDECTITVTWNAVDGATGYEISRHKQDGISSWEVLATTKATSYEDCNDVHECVLYHYRVRAFNSAGFGPLSSECIGWRGRHPDECACPPPPPPPPPVDPEPCGPCDGKVSALTLQYNGAATAQITVNQKLGGTVFNASVAPGESFSFVGADKQNTLGPDIDVLVNGNLATRIHTSCSQYIAAGLVFGDFLILAGESRNGGPLCAIDGFVAPTTGTTPDDPHAGHDCPPPPVAPCDCPPAACGPCEGKVDSLTLAFNGATASQIEVRQKDGFVVFDAVVQPGASFTFVGQDRNNTLGTDIDLFVNGVFNARVHTSCSQPIGAGLTFGSFTVVAGTSLNGGALCPLP